ncbi:MAG: ImmA/IrrE family metallo-endopeptidase [Blastocatellia bacterium]
MWLDNAGQEVVNNFWRRCGEVEEFPRRLERSVSLALPVCVVKLPRLKLAAVENWLARRGESFQFNCRNRAMRGCLIAFGGDGFIFVDGSDPEDEQRFTLAHELAHFLTDYWLAREKALKKFGPAVAGAFDGLRRPTVTERVHAVLAGTQIGVYTNLLERDEASGDFDSSVWEIEDRADRIALALLAPPEEVLALADTTASQFAERHSAIAALLHRHFGLPESIAAAYGRALLNAIGRGPSWVETLWLK